MATNPDDRFQTADEAAAALRSMLRPKNAPPSRPAPTETATASVPEPVPKAETTVEAPAPPVPARIPVSKPKPDLPARNARTKGKRILVAAAVAAVAVAAGGSIMFFMSSQDVGPAAEQGSLDTNNGPIVPAGAPEVREPSPVIENTKQTAAVAVKEEPPGAPVVPAAAAVVRKPSLVIENPKEGATVGMKEDLTGRIETEGWPVIFVQADIPGQPWWCQAPVATVDGGKFTAKVIFGDELTPSGMRFRIAGIVARTREEANKFAIGSRQPFVPEGFPRSVEVTVTHR